MSDHYDHDLRTAMLSTSRPTPAVEGPDEMKRRVEWLMSLPPDELGIAGCRRGEIEYQYNARIARYCTLVAIGAIDPTSTEENKP